MSTIAEIQQAILVLPEADYVQLRKWISELDWERWDSRLQADAEAGTLDFLVEEARDPSDHRALEDL
ncbi:MAG: hypothetical protein OXS47_13910 [Chloroflexota bacterium]|nr:hypothetical protein [Chloroflexota bacterium]